MEWQGVHRIRYGKVRNPPDERGLPEFDVIAYHRINCEDDRHLKQHWQASAQRIEPVLFVQLDHFLVQPLLIVLVFLTDFVHQRLQLLHLARALVALFRQRMEKDFDENRENDNHPPVIGYEPVGGKEEPEDEFRNRAENTPAKVSSAFQIVPLGSKYVNIERSQVQESGYRVFREIEGCDAPGVAQTRVLHATSEKPCVPPVRTGRCKRREEIFVPNTNPVGLPRE
ncbi:MAG: hypothetical protein BWY06_03133 [Candidatus Latescibacteria bacterium ADurb.Bin168]|nr:MAG: hypothetical protein BWY06_03133 [Candidatus Latescibacteria bacterium ADurb.Bin168]